MATRAMTSAAVPFSRAFALALALAVIAGCAGAPATPDGAPRAAEVKPQLDEGDAAVSQPRLEAYLARVLARRTVDEHTVVNVKLVDAHPFSEGHHHETWRLTVDLDGRLTTLALKIFSDPARAEANAAQFRAAQAHEWPVPAEYARGPATPYSDKPALLMEFLSGGSLRTRVKNLFERQGTPDVAAIAASYADVTAALGALHKAHLRPRNDRDRSGAPALRAMSETCAREGWCGDQVRAEFEYLAASIDQGPVTFVHGDLYEQQAIIGPDGRLAGFIDLDEAGFADPASDLGQLLGHVLLLNPRTRQVSWGVPNPTPEETRAVAEAMLASYRQAADLSGDEWRAFLRRARGHMWLRFGHVMADLRDNPHGRAAVALLEADRTAIAASDPLADFMIATE